jgi:hypothetical protein
MQPRRLEAVVTASDSIATMRPVHLLALAGAVFVAGCGGPEPPPFKPLADNKLLMQAVVDPNADIVWDAVKTIDTKEGTEEIRPRNEEQWTAVRNAAITLAESGNLLMMVPRAKDGGEWMTMAQKMIDTSEAAIRAAEAKNADRLFTVGGDIYESCSACHQKYMDAIVNANK